MEPQPRILLLLIVTTLLLAAEISRGQTPTVATPDSTPQAELATEWAEAEAPNRKLVKWNELDGRFATMRFGGGLLYEVATFAQDEESKQQFDLATDHKVRDTRLIFSGRFKFKRPITWKAGVMYDGPTDSWLIRETGIMIAVPELWGNLFIGRTKEGFSLNKVMVGYAGWTMERSTINDATIPILADGVKWLGISSNRRWLWNIGWYHDWLSEGQGFSTYDNQFVVRIAWVPALSETAGTLLHIGLNGRYGKANEGMLQLRSRPEAFPAPYFVDTGKFPAHDTRMTSLEAYYRPGPLLFGTEYFLQKANAEATGDPFCHGGEAVATWLITGETRAYTSVGGIFKAVSPAKTVFEGGPGAWEAVLRISYIDLDSGTLRGGKFWRITPMANWHLSDQVRLELTYGYGTLERFEHKGGTHFFQSRIQMQI